MLKHKSAGASHHNRFIDPRTCSSHGYTVFQDRPGTAAACNGTLYVTGRLPIDPADVASPLSASIEAQAERGFTNLRLTVEAAGG
jgi:enamine deaminase RidA (YjgF/YER057c/UK114 family)